jgi:uncharacterized protein (DUF4415 family)
MPATSKTDWARVKQAAASNAAIPFEPGDGPYDPNDEAATEAAWESGRVTHGVRGKQKKPTKLLVPIRLSRAVVDHFKAQGSGWQTRIDQALVRVVEQDLRQSSAKK